MKLVPIQNEIRLFNINHWMLRSVSDSSKAFISIADGAVHLSLDMQVRCTVGEPILYFPNNLRPIPVYLPPGYADDTSAIYYNGNALRSSASLSGVWVRRQWSWFVGKAITSKITERDLGISPPPVL